MQKTLVNFLAAFLSLVVICLGVALYLAQSEKGGFSMQTIRMIEWLYLLSPLYMAVPGFFLFVGVKNIAKDQIYKHLRLPGVAYIVLMAIWFVLFLFVYDNTTLKLFEGKYQEVENEYQINKKNAESLAPFYAAFEEGRYNDVTQRETALKRLATLAEKNPWTLEYPLFIKKIEREYPTPKEVEIFKNRSKLESLASEAYNAKDFTVAIEIYKKLYALFPDEDKYAEIRGNYFQKIKDSQLLAKDPLLNLNKEIRENMVLVKELENLDNIYKTKEIYDAWKEARRMLFAWDSSIEVKKTHEKIVRQIIDKEFLLHNYLSLIEYGKSLTFYSNYSFTVQGVKFQAERAVIHEWNLYLENLELITPKGYQSKDSSILLPEKRKWKYARIRGNRLQLVDRPFVPSYVVEHPLFEELPRLGHLLTGHNVRLFWFAGPFALMKHSAFFEMAYPEYASLIPFLITLKLSVPLFLLSLFLFYAYISLAIRKQLLTITSFLFLPTSLVVAVGGHLFIAYLLLIAQARNQTMGLMSFIWAFPIFLFLSTILFLIAHKEEISNENNF